MDDDARQRQLQALWLHVTNAIKKQIVNPTVWMGMEAAKPLTIDGDQLILGIDSQHYHLATNLEQVGPRTAIEKQLTAAARGELHFRIVQAETIADWEELKERDRIAREMAAQPTSRQTTERRGTISSEAAESWDDCITQVHRAFMTLAVKSIPQARAQYILDVMPTVLASEQKIHAAGRDELGDRGLGRVLEKIAQLAETDSTTVALEFVRYKRDHHASSLPGVSIDEPPTGIQAAPGSEGVE